MARNYQKIIQLLRSSQIYTPTIVEGVQTKSALENAMESFNADFVAAAEPQDGEIMLARYQETGEEVKAVLAAYTDKNNETGFTFYLDSVAISDLLDELSDKIDVIETKNSIQSSDDSITVTAGDASNPTDVIVNVDATTIVKDSTTGALKSNLTIIKEDETTQGVTLDTNVKEQYKLVYEGSTTPIGQVIKVYKDSSLVEVYIGASTDTINASTGEITKNVVADPQSLNFKYQLANGTYQLVKIDVSKFLTETEFGAGLKVQNGVVSLDVRGTVTVGEDVTYVAINVNDETDKLTQEEYDELTSQEKESYYTYTNSETGEMARDVDYNELTPQAQAEFSPISIQDTVPVQANVFNENGGVLDVNAIQEAIDYASLSAAEGVRVNGSDSIRVDSGNTVYVRLSGQADNALTIETGTNKGLYLSSTWDCGEY